MKRNAFLLFFVVACMSLPLSGDGATKLNVEDVHVAQQASVVYVTPYGEKYHREACRTIKHSDKNPYRKQMPLAGGMVHVRFVNHNGYFTKLKDKNFNENGFCHILCRCFFRFSHYFNKNIL